MELPWCTLHWYGTTPELYYSEWCDPDAHYSGVELLWNYPGARCSAWCYTGTTLVHTTMHGVTLELSWCTLQRSIVHDVTLVRTILHGATLVHTLQRLGATLVHTLQRHGATLVHTTVTW